MKRRWRNNTIKVRKSDEQMSTHFQAFLRAAGSWKERVNTNRLIREILQTGVLSAGHRTSLTKI